jgi:hypothetical protein
MTNLRYSSLLVVLATFLSTVNAFVVGNSVQFPAKASVLRAADENDNDETNEPTPSFPQSQKNDEPLDPLIMSLTRNDQISESSVIKAPLFGEIPVDGSLVVLVPALVIGIVGFAMSINIIINSQDAIVDSLNQLSEDATAAAVAKTNIAAPLGQGCRGLCSNQQEDLQGLQKFMQGIGK